MEQRPHLVVGWVLGPRTPAGIEWKASERGSVDSRFRKGMGVLAWHGESGFQGAAMEEEEPRKCSAGGRGNINKEEDSAATDASTSMSTSPGSLLLLSRALSLRFCAHFALHARRGGQVYCFFFCRTKVRGSSHAIGVFA